MDREAGKMLTTMLRDPQSGERLIRLSIWVNPDDILVSDQDTGDGPTIKVEAQKGRRTLYGTIDRDAYRIYLTKDEAPLTPTVGQPIDSVERKPILSLFLGSSKPKAVNATMPKAKAGPLIRRA